MKKIAIVCLFEKTALFIQKQLYALIGEYVDIHALSLEKTIYSNIQSDLVLLGDAAVGKIIHNYIHDDIEMLSMKMTIGKSGFEKLLSIPEKSRVLLINDTVQSTYDTINLLYEVGIRHLEFIPYYPNMVYNYDVDIAVTPDEEALVPPSIKRIVNIGGRVIDPYMIINILTKLELVNNKTLRDIVFNRTNDYIPRNPQLLDVIASILKSRNHLEKIIEVIDEGVIAYDEGQHIILFNEVAEKIFLPTVKAMNNENRTFKGCLYFGLMLTPKGPKVIEYNCRFGDPETQVVLPLLKTDLLTIMRAVHDETLSFLNVEFKDESAACVVIASGGYPLSYGKGYEIDFGDSENTENVTVFHAGTAEKDGKIVTSGGRVLGVTATGKDLNAALSTAYKATEQIKFKDAFYRKDIGARALAALKK